MSNPGRKISFGALTAQDGARYQTIKHNWIEAEALGFDSCWLGDHLMGTIVDRSRPHAECFSWMAALAEATTTIRFGALVACNSYRNPALLAKIAASIDQLSNGRLEFGIGAGWYGQEYEAFGYEFPSISVRLAQLEESLEIYRRMMTEEATTFEGQYYRIKDCLSLPGPVQKPYPPILIGGNGEKKTLRLVAKYADKWNFDHLSTDQFARKTKILEQHCEDVGRDIAAIEKTYLCFIYIGEDRKALAAELEKRAQTRRISVDELRRRHLAGTPDEIVARIREYVDAGVTYFICLFGDQSDLTTMRLFAKEVMPAFKRQGG